MAQTPLFPRPGETGPVTARPMLVCTGGDAACALVARLGLIKEGPLTSLQEGFLEFDLYTQQYRQSWLTRENPFLAADDTQDLDERGLVRPGTVLKAWSVLASLLCTDLRSTKRPARAGHVLVHDDSWQAPPDWAGATVVSVQVLGRRDLRGG